MAEGEAGGDAAVGRGALVRRWWAGELGGVGRVLSLLAWPSELLFRWAVAVRNGAYEHGLRRVEQGPIPVVSVGNLLVGGTGKTPVAAWLLGRLQARGRRPALVTRGYGSDEVALHRRWNPEAPVVVAQRRIRGVERAAEQGADVAVVDDGFQHRRLARDLDIVLVPAEGPLRGRLLPRGPFREGPGALRRADIVVVTRRSADEGRAEEMAEEVRLLAPGAAVVRIALEPGEWTDLSGEPAEPPASDAPGVLAVCSVARPEPFRRTLRERLERPVELLSFPDHHDYDAVDARRIAERARGRPVVTTEKDAVKLLPFRLELRDARVLPLRVRPEGAEELERALEIWGRAANEGAE